MAINRPTVTNILHQLNLFTWHPLISHAAAPRGWRGDVQLRRGPGGSGHDYRRAGSGGLGGQTDIWNRLGDETRGAITEAHGNLVEMARAEDSERLDLLRRRASLSMVVLKNLATAIEANPTPLQLAEHERILAHVEIESIRRYAEGDNSVAVLRSDELRLRSEDEKVLAENAQLSSELTQAVASLVQGTRQNIAQETSQARAVQTSGAITLIVVVVLSLACSILIIWLYVDRNLIARLTALSRSMLAIADGNLDTSLPAAGRDEIGRMAKALAIFRDTAVEVKKTNLREITEARRRLIAAIESISEGFSLYDADDRLAICNSTWARRSFSCQKRQVTASSLAKQLSRMVFFTLAPLACA